MLLVCVITSTIGLILIMCGLRFCDYKYARADTYEVQTVGWSGEKVGSVASLCHNRHNWAHLIMHDLPKAAIFKGSRTF